MELNEVTVEKETLYSGRIIDLEVQKVRLPDGRYSKREIIRHSDAVAVFAVDDDENVYLVEQFRKPIDSLISEIPAGHVEEGEEPQYTALRELCEETGLMAEEITLLNKYYSSPGFTDETIYFFMARKLTSAEQSLDRDEFINVKKIPFDELLKLVRENKIIDGKTILATYFYAFAREHRT